MLVCYILMIISFVAIVLNGLQGFLKFNIYNAGHIEFAFVSTILYMFTQTLIMFYFIGAGKIVGIDWRLYYNATTSEVRTQNRGIYFISLKVREPVGSAQEIKEIQFQATPQQLEDMLGTIRDATKQVDRVMK